MSAPSHTALSGLRDSSNCWAQVAQIRPYQKVYVENERRITVSAGDNSSWVGIGWPVQTLSRVWNTYVRGFKANRQDTLAWLRNARAEGTAAIRGLEIAIRDPSATPEFLTRAIRCLSRLERSMERGGKGLRHLAVTYRNQPAIASELTSLREDITRVALRQIQQLRVICQAKLYARIDRIALATGLKTFSQQVAMRDDGYLCVDAGPRWRHRLATCGEAGQIETDTQGVDQLIRGVRVDLRPTTVRGSTGGEIAVPHQLAYDLPRLGTLSLQGELIYDITQPRRYNLYDAYQKLSGILGENCVQRLAGPMSQACLAELTTKVTEIGSKHRPVIARGREQHMAIDIHDNVLAISHTLHFTLQNLDNIEETLGRMQATRHTRIQLPLMFTVGENGSQKCLSPITVIDQYSNPQFS